MSYVEKNLLDGETISYRGGLHWIIYGRSIVIVALGVAMLLPWHRELPADQANGLPNSLLSQLWMLGVGVIAVGLLAALPALIASWSTELVVTSRRVIAKHGLIRRDSIEMLHSKIESILVHQSLLGRVLDYGTLEVRGTGGGMEPIRNVARPMQFRNAAMAQP